MMIDRRNVGNEPIICLSLGKSLTVFHLASVNVVANAREVGMDGLIRMPLLEETLHIGAVCTVQSVLGIFATLFLSRPGEGALKVELAFAAHVTLSLLDKIAEVDFWVSIHRRSDRVSVEVELFQIANSHVVLHGVISVDLCSWMRRVAAYEHIKDDLVLFVASINALVDCTGDIHVDDGSTVHEGAHTPDMVREHAWDRC